MGKRIFNKLNGRRKLSRRRRSLAMLKLSGKIRIAAKNRSKTISQL